ncbi:MAG: CNNM domain-containing protein, partial [Thiogranum sp.]
MNDIPLGALFGALIFLIILSAFFSGSETGLMTLNRYRLRHLARTRHAGARRAQKLLERRSWKNTRLLGSFNQDVNNWLDFWVYTNFVDRDGKFQLQMLSNSAFAPLGRSTMAMLREEAYHLATGTD